MVRLNKHERLIIVKGRKNKEFKKGFLCLQGDAADIQQESLGCYVYEGSIHNDMYPVYVNQRGQFLTPDYYRSIAKWKNIL